MKKVIFLDIDGVLCVMCGKKDKYGHLFHPKFEDNLSELVKKTGAKIVISSTWRLAGLNIMQDMWRDRGLDGDIIDITPITNFVRGEEVSEWLRNNKVDRYVIIDDVDIDFNGEHTANFVCTSGNYKHKQNIRGAGLTKECTEKAIQILNL